MALLHGVLPQSSTSSYHTMEELNLLGANPPTLLTTIITTVIHEDHHFPSCAVGHSLLKFVNRLFSGVIRVEVE